MVIGTKKLAATVRSDLCKKCGSQRVKFMGKYYCIGCGEDAAIPFAPG